MFIISEDNTKGHESRAVGEDRRLFMTCKSCVKSG
jgi:hypothetical protein